MHLSRMIYNTIYNISLIILEVKERGIRILFRMVGDFRIKNSGYEEEGEGFNVVLLKI